MQISHLKNLLHIYDTQEKGYRRRLLGLFNIDRKEVAALREFLKDLKSRQVQESDDVSYNDFLGFLAQTERDGLISDAYLQQDSASSRLFKSWKEEIRFVFDLSQIAVRPDLLTVNRPPMQSVVQPIPVAPLLISHTAVFITQINQNTQAQLQQALVQLYPNIVNQAHDPRSTMPSSGAC